MTEQHNKSKLKDTYRITELPRAEHSNATSREDCQNNKLNNIPKFQSKTPKLHH